MIDDIKIIINNEISNEDKSVIEGGLKQYNEKYTGKQHFIPLRIVTKNAEGKIIGGISGIIIWGWLFIERLWINRDYQKLGLGSYLLGKAEIKALENGIIYSKINSPGDELKDFYTFHNYKLNCFLEDRPKGFNYYFLEKKLSKKQIIKSIPKDINIINNPSDDDIKNLLKLSSNDYNKITGNKLFKNIYITAKNQENEILGGMVAYIGWEWLYISTLWVHEQHRNKKIATKLVDEVEKHAIRLGVNKSFLGTTDFQAKNFYQKNGYNVFGISKNLPKGYNNYSMKKYLKK